MKKPLPPLPEKVSIIDRVSAVIEIVLMGTLILISIIVITQLLKG